MIGGPSVDTEERRRTRTIYRHRLPVRIAHWINVACLTILLMSGLGIVNGWPALYWGDRSDFERPLFAMYAINDKAGHAVGITQALGHKFDTTASTATSHSAMGAAVSTRATATSGTRASSF